MKIGFWGVTFFAPFFGAILGPILLPFSGPNIFIFFYFLTKSDSWDVPWEFLGASWTTKRPRCSQDGPKSPHKAPKGSPRASKRPPEGLQDAFSRLQMASKNVSKGPSKKEKNVFELFNRCGLTLLSLNVFLLSSYYLCQHGLQTSNT